MPKPSSTTGANPNSLSDGLPQLLVEMVLWLMILIAWPHAHVSAAPGVRSTNGQGTQGIPCY